MDKEKKKKKKKKKKDAEELYEIVRSTLNLYATMEEVVVVVETGRRMAHFDKSKEREGSRGMKKMKSCIAIQF
uniref:Uncharacterized protein n=1 Tax=Trichuris muris TaxID=70415 RepID=A0A5S6QWJ5_TRIMR